MAALVLLAVGVNAVIADDDELAETVEEQVVPPARRVDLIELVESFERSEDFGFDEQGATIGLLDMVLDENRVVRVTPGTPGEISCANLRNPDRCVVFADLLGEAVIWFAVQPRGPNDTVELGPIVDLTDGYAIFESGWEIKYPPIIERDCPDEFDVRSFSDFLRRFGPNSTSIIDLETRQVTEVRCGAEVVPTTIVDDETTPEGSGADGVETPIDTGVASTAVPDL